MNQQRFGLTQDHSAAMLNVTGPRIVQLVKDGKLSRLADGTIDPISVRERVLAMAQLRAETSSAIDGMLFGCFGAGELPDEIVVRLAAAGTPLSAETVARVWDRYCAMRSDPRVVEARKQRNADEAAKAAVAAAREARLAEANARVEP